MKKILVLIIMFLLAARGQALLEVTLVHPDTSLTTNIIQNSTFPVNATVYCRAASCGEVNATLLYNATTTEPDTVIGTTVAVPFYTDVNPQSCGPLTLNQFCQINWTVNATGDIGTTWKIGALFSSNDTNIEQNTTANATLSIIQCSIDFTLNWQSIDFTTLAPNTKQNSALGNSNDDYNISINAGSCATDLYLRGTNLTNSTLGTEIGVSNVTWSNLTNSYAASEPLSEADALIAGNIQPVTNVTTWYWMNVPPVYAGIYTGVITLVGVINGQIP